jgi:hypothetical protein
MTKSMPLIFNLLVSLIHFIFCYAIFLSVLLSNNINVLTFFLIIMIITKISFWMCGDRCILSLYENNTYFATTAQLLVNTLTNIKLKDEDMELILINIMILIVLNKLYVLLLLSHYKLPFLQKYIS